MLLTRLHSFLLLDRPISSRHLTHYSQDVLSDAGQIETHCDTSLCGCVCVEVHILWARAGVCGSLGASVCVKGGLWDTRDLVLYDVWQDMRRHAWNEIDCHIAEGATYTRGPSPWGFSRLMSYLKSVLISYIMFWLTLWHRLLLTCDMTCGKQ